MPLWRSCDAQRRLLGGGKVAQAHLLAIALHPRLIGLGLAGLDEVHAEVARLVIGHEQRQLLRLRLLPRLLARQRQRHCRPLRRLPPLRRPRDAQRRLLGSGEAAQDRLLAAAAHPRLIGLGFARKAEAHADVACGVVGHAQRQPLHLRLRAPHQRSPTRRDRGLLRKMRGGEWPASGRGGLECVPSS
eukprot:scaffold119931_cov57-Phaeocystis_antarctica.AAC.2